MRFDRVKNLISQFASKQILVIGDLMLDEFVWGRVSRISPEAPVPVVEVIRETSYPGGAANVARNVREFADRVHLCGLVGKDVHAERLRSILGNCGIQLGALQVDAGYQTIVKTRIIARQQQVVRVDREVVQTLQPETQARALAAIRALLPEIDAVIFEDYGKGFLNQKLVDEVTEATHAAGKIITADPNPRNRIEWHRLTAVKPNRAEAFAAAGEPFQEPARNPLEDEALRRVGNKLLARWEPEALLITLGEQGMMLFRPQAQPVHIHPQTREVYDVSGAGDTAIALLTLGLASHATPEEAAEISNHASAVVVGKLGTATLTPAELRASFHEAFSREG
jgi:D-glycero-beta-D-manno-heptose-7-phosphate kinase